MTRLVSPILHYAALDVEATPAEWAAEAARLAKGGAIVNLTVPGGQVVTVAPDDDPGEVTDRMSKAVAPPKQAAKTAAPVAASARQAEIEAAAASGKAQAAKAPEAKAPSAKVA